MRARRRPTPFVIFTTPRTGSSWLVELLDAHPSVTCYGERFYPGRGVRRENGNTGFVRFDDLPTRFLRRTRPTATLELEAYVSLLFGARRQGIQAVGLKVMLEQARARGGLMAALGRRRVRAVHLVRRSTLERLISLRAAVERGTFRARVGDELPAVSVLLRTDKLVRDLDTMEAAVAESRALLECHGLPSLELSYEHLVERTDGELARVAAFLELEQVAWEARSTLVVTNPHPLDVVENLHDVRRALEGTRYGWMLETGGRTPTTPCARSHSIDEALPVPGTGGAPRR
jgi:LPS sulfotransferase NodH